MGWEVVKIPTDNRGRKEPFASVSNGKLSLSVSACELIDNYEEFSYVRLQKDRKKRLRIGVEFLKEATQDTIKISRKKTKDGEIIGGIDISSKKVLESLFGAAATSTKVTRYDVKVDNSFNNFLVVFA